MKIVSFSIVTDKEVERFWAKVNVAGPEECWEWTGCVRTDGYGRSRAGGEQRGAHRVSWVIANGRIPRGESVLHKCNNRACVNPSHLCTHKESTKDTISKGHSILVRGNLNPSAKLTDSKVAEMRERYNAGGVTLKALSSEYGVGVTATWKVINRVSWSHVE